MPLTFANIPGVSTTLLDGMTNLPPDTPLTRSLIVIGRGLWGPVNVPVSVGSLASAQKIFGPIMDKTGDFNYGKAGSVAVVGTPPVAPYCNQFAANQVVLMAAEAFTGGCTDVRVMRLGLAGGVKASLTLKLVTDPDDADDGLKIEAAYPGFLGNGFKVATAYTTDSSTPTHLRIKVPTFLGGQTFTFVLANYIDLQDLVAQANQVLKGAVVLSVVNSTATTIVTTAIALIKSDTAATYTVMHDAVALGTTQAGETPIYTGVLGANDDLATLTNVYTALGDPLLDPGNSPTALQNLLNYEVDFIASSFLYVDQITGTADNVMQRLVDFAHLQHQNDIPTNIVLGVSPMADVSRSSIGTRKTLLMNYTGSNVYPAVPMATGVTSQSGQADISNAGRYLQIVAGPQANAVAPDVNGYVTNGAVHIASFRAAHPHHVPLTRKIIPGLLGLAFEFSSFEKDALAGGVGTDANPGGAYVVLETRNDLVRPVTGPTCAQRKSDYHDSYVLDTAQAVMDIVSNVAESYIGNPFGDAQKNAMATQIAAALDDLAELNALVGGANVGYKFSITQTNRDSVLGRAVITIAIRPTWELKWIDLTVSVNP